MTESTTEKLQQQQQQQKTIKNYKDPKVTRPLSNNTSVMA